MQVICYRLSPPIATYGRVDTSLLVQCSTASPCCCSAAGILTPPDTSCPSWQQVEQLQQASERAQLGTAAVTVKLAAAHAQVFYV
jgi:hypothetical protein